jgi:hypothetical protein
MLSTQFGQCARLNFKFVESHRLAQRTFAAKEVESLEVAVKRRNRVVNPLFWIFAHRHCAKMRPRSGRLKIARHFSAG